MAPGFTEDGETVRTHGRTGGYPSGNYVQPRPALGALTDEPAMAPVLVRPVALAPAIANVPVSAAPAAPAPVQVT